MTISDCFQPPDHVGLRATHHFCYQAHRTHAQPTKLDPDMPAIVLALYTKPSGAKVQFRTSVRTQT